MNTTNLNTVILNLLTKEAMAAAFPIKVQQLLNGNTDNVADWVTAADIYTLVAGKTTLAEIFKTVEIKQDTAALEKAENKVKTAKEEQEKMRKRKDKAESENARLKQELQAAKERIEKLETLSAPPSPSVVIEMDSEEAQYIASVETEKDWQEAIRSGASESLPEAGFAMVEECLKDEGYWEHDPEEETTCPWEDQAQEVECEFDAEGNQFQDEVDAAGLQKEFEKAATYVEDQAAIATDGYLEAEAEVEWTYIAAQGGGTFHSREGYEAFLEKREKGEVEKQEVKREAKENPILNQLKDRLCTKKPAAPEKTLEEKRAELVDLPAHEQMEQSFLLSLQEASQDNDDMDRSHYADSVLLPLTTEERSGKNNGILGCISGVVFGSKNSRKMFEHQGGVPVVTVEELWSCLTGYLEDDGKALWTKTPVEFGNGLADALLQETPFNQETVELLKEFFQLTP